MTRQCPNCSNDFVEQRDIYYRCEGCGWFRNVDGKWHSCVEPVKVTEPDPNDLNVPAPSGPVLDTESDESKIAKLVTEDRLDFNVRSYLGGLVTVTTEEDEDEEND